MRPRHLFTRRLPALLVALAAIGIAIGTAQPANGDVIVALSPSRIAIDAPIRQGDVVRLPSLTISNRGDEPAQFRVGVRPQPGQPERAPMMEWFSITPQEFALGPGDSQLAVVEMVVPRDARPDHYRAVLTASTSDADGAQGGARVRATVGAPLLFQVENRNFHFYDPAVNFFQHSAPFSYIAVGPLLALALIIWLRQRYSVGLGIRIEKR